MKKAKDFRNLSDDELEVALLDLQKQLFDLRNEKQETKKLDKPHLLREKRKEIAKLLTVKRERAA